MPDGEAGQVEVVVVGEVAGVLGRLAAEQHALGTQAALVDAGHDVGHLLGLELADHQVVEEEERHGAAGRDVVDAHRHGVDADGAEDAHLAGDHRPWCRRRRCRPRAPASLMRRHAHDAAEAADALEHERVLDRAQALLEQPHGFVAGLHVDAGLLVGEVLVGGHDPPWLVIDPSPRALFYGTAMKTAARETPETLTCDEVTFALRRSARRRTIGISIPREGPPVVAVPSRCPRKTAESAVRGKLAWVRRKLRSREALAQLPPHRYLAGERFPYLGRELELILVGDGPAPSRRDRGPQLAFDLAGTAGDDVAGAQASPGAEGGARSQTSPGAVGVDADGLLRLRDGRFELARSAQPRARSLFLVWYRRRAGEVLSARVAHFAALVGVAPPPIAVKDMRSRWGSCSAKGRVSLHWGLILLEPALLDYVVVHELVHLLELNHQPAFWRGVERLVPDYRERRKRLRTETARSVI